MACEKDCGAIANERLRYFTGRHMTARDFADEQSHTLTHRYLHNRILHGWGVVCGLHVYQHPSENCRKDHVRVECGLAIDCCGREIVVPKPAVPPPIPWDTKPSPAATPASPAVPAQPTAPASEQQPAGVPPQNATQPPAAPQTPAHSQVEDLARDDDYYPLLCLEYCETEVECVPVLYSEGNCDEQRREFSRVREGYRFCWHWIRYAELTKYFWKITAGGCPEPYTDADGRVHPCPDDCDEPSHEDPIRCCLEPQCPPDHCVAIAWIHVHKGDPITSGRIVTLGRPMLQPPRDALTHICGINWPHGGVVSRNHLENHLNELRIRFDRRLKDTGHHHGDSGPRGVNQCTFVVQFGGGYEDLDFVTYTKAPYVKDGCVAIFTIDPRGRPSNQEKPYAYLENQIVFITLKCDFVLDCHGVPVDGNHLGGVLPSGDGVRGGVFESWFRVLPDHDWEEYQTQHPEQEEQQS